MPFRARVGTMNNQAAEAHANRNGAAKAVVDLDVRQTLREGRDPFAEIMATVDALASGQGLRLVAPFMPAPLLLVLERRGFSHQVSKLQSGGWEVLFQPACT